MKKFSLIFVALVAIAWSASAQVQGGANYVDETTQASDYVLVGSTMPYYAKPDSYIHPDYNAAAPAWQLTAGYTWTWTTPGCTQGNAADNYVEITFPATAGTVATSVVEVATAGGCTDASPSTHTVTVIDKPIFSITNGSDVATCNPAADITAPVIDFTLGNAADGGVRIIYSLTIYTLKNTGTWVPDQYYDINNANPNAVAFNAIDVTTADVQNIADGGAIHAGTAPTYEAIGGQSTRFVYTVKSINTAISRKCDYLVNSAAVNANFTFYNTTGGVYAGAGDDVSFTFTIHPAPNTGEIYHIKNDWSDN